MVMEDLCQTIRRPLSRVFSHRSLKLHPQSHWNRDGFQTLTRWVKDDDFPYHLQYWVLRLTKKAVCMDGWMDGFSRLLISEFETHTPFYILYIVPSNRLYMNVFHVMEHGTTLCCVSEPWYAERGDAESQPVQVFHTGIFSVHVTWDDQWPTNHFRMKRD